MEAAAKRKDWGDQQVKLVAKLKPETVDDLVAQFPGVRLRVPTASQLKRAQRVLKVQQLLEDGLTHRATARRLRAPLSSVVRNAKHPAP